MIHLSMETLLALRERRSEPGSAAAWEHVQACSDCRNELDRLHQRVAQLKALPTLRSARDAWPAVAARVRADRWRRRSLQGAGLIGLAMAASLAITVVTDRPQQQKAVAATVAQAESLRKVQARSRELEHTLNSYELNARVLDGQTAGLVQEAEDRLAKVDQAIEAAERAEREGRTQQVLQLWQERNDLLDMIVNAHVNPATHVEF